jgi:hypothetical protein
LCMEWLGDNTWAAWWKAKWISNRSAIFTQSYKLAIDVLLLTTCCVTIWKVFCKCTRTLLPKKNKKDKLLIFKKKDVYNTMTNRTWYYYPMLLTSFMGWERY